MLRRSSVWCGVALSALAAPVQAQSRGWLLTLSAAEGYHDNIGFGSTSGRFQSLGQGERSAFVTHVGGSLARTFHGADSTLSLGAEAFGLFHGGLSDLNRLIYSANAAYTRPLSERSTISLSDDYSSKYTTWLIDDFADEGLLHPLAGVRRNNAGFEYRHEVSTRTSMHANVRQTLFFFQDDPELVDGWRLSSNLGLSRQFEGDKSGSINAGYTRSGRTDNPADVYKASLGWTQKLGRTIGLGVEGGAAYIRVGGQTKTVFNGGGTLVGSWRIGEGNLSTGYNRFIRVAGGTDRVRLVDVVHLSYRRNLVEKLNFSLTAGYARNRDPFDSTFKVEAQTLGAGLNMALTRTLHLGVKYTLARRVIRESTHVSQRANLSLSYVQPF